MADDETQALVIDNGSGMCKAGFLETTLHERCSPRLWVAQSTQVSWSAWSVYFFSP